MRTSTYAFALVLLMTCASAIGADPAVPAKTAADWAADPQGALSAVLAANSKLLAFYQSITTSGNWAIWGMGALGLVVAVCKFVPQVQPFTDLLWRLLSHKDAKAADDKKEVLSQGFLDVAAVMRSFPKDSKLGDVIDKLDRRLPESVKAVYRQWEASQAENRPDVPKPTLSAADLTQLMASIAQSSTAPAPTTTPVTPG